MDNQPQGEVWPPAPNQPQVSSPIPDKGKMRVAFAVIAMGVSGILLSAWVGWLLAQDEASRLMYRDNPLSLGGKLGYMFAGATLIPPFNLGTLGGIFAFVKGCLLWRKAIRS